MHDASNERSSKRSIPAGLRGKRAWRGNALWVTLGIVGGAIFCQAFGLPSIVADIARGPDAETSLQGHQLNPGDSIETGSLPSIHRVDQARCTSLALERTTNRTLARRCPKDGLTLRLEGDSDRGDLPRVAGNEAR
jgi:hypothetical protein